MRYVLWVTVEKQNDHYSILTRIENKSIEKLIMQLLWLGSLYWILVMDWGARFNSIAHKTVLVPLCPQTLHPHTCMQGKLHPSARTPEAFEQSNVHICNRMNNHIPPPIYRVKAYLFSPTTHENPSSTLPTPTHP